jgi:hypothetical protein
MLNPNSTRLYLLCSVTILLITFTSCVQHVEKPLNDKYDGRCTLKLPQSPEVRGLRLGMTLDQLKARFPNLYIPPVNDFDHRIRNINIDEAEIKAGKKSVWANSGLDLEGLRGLSIHLFNDRIWSIYLHYEDAPRLTNYQFRSQLSQSLHLPEWGIDMDLECFDFRVTAYGDEREGEPSLSHPTLSLLDLTVQNKFDAEVADKHEREKSETEKWKGTFHP